MVIYYLYRRFDLKEEYADCLLLCRHCRCLFWKSIGHPCIEKTESTPNCLYHPYLNQSCSDPVLNNQRSSHMDSSGGDRANRNRSQQFNVGDRRDRRASNLDRSNNDQLQAPDRSGISVAALSRNFDDRMRNVVQNSRGLYSDTPREQRSDNSEARDRIANNDINNMRANPGQGRPARRRGEDLVPKHVAISPQAFLKFFSL